MATFRKRGPHQWQALVRKKGHPSAAKTFDTKAAAVTWARATEYEMDQGLFVSRAKAESTTLGELLERYLEEITPLKMGVGPESARIKALLRHKLANRYVAGIRSVDIARYRDERLRVVCPGTAKRDMVILSHLFEVARKEWGIHVSNPVRDVRLPAHDRARDRRLQTGNDGSEDEESRLMTACRKARNPFLLPIVRLALETAMRQSELASLRWEHISLQRRVAFLPHTKNGHTRSVPLSSTAVGVLTALPRSTNGEVFPGLTAEAIKRAFIRAVRRAGIINLRFHDLRHEATTRLFEKGLNIMEVATITGHRDLRMLRRYTHLKAEDLARKLG